MDREIPAIRVSATEHPRIFKLNRSPRRGYSYDAYIWIPEQLIDVETNRLMVVPNNTGRGDDSLQFHDSYVFELLSGRSRERNIAESLNMPLLMPVFPRSYSEWEKYFHSLNSIALRATGSEKRIDLQLIAMIKDTHEYLESETGMLFDDKVLMQGFSASGDFVNRFVMLHPEVVHAAGVGGTAGNLMLPIEEYEGRRLTYPLGIADFKKITGEDFNLEAWRKVHLYIYNGKLDTNEPYPKEAEHDPSGHGRLVHKLYGSTILDRFPKTSAIYHEFTDNCQIVLYTYLGHTSAPSDVQEFLRHNSGDEFVPIEPLFPATIL